MTRGPDGDGLNTNADDAAAGVAAWMGAAELLFVSDVPGVKAGGAWVDELDAGRRGRRCWRAARRRAECAPSCARRMRARAAGVGRVRIGAVEMLNDERAGTRIEITRETAHAGD